MGRAFHEAVLGGHEGVAKDLLASAVPVSVKASRGRTPLHLAAREGEAGMVQLLLLNGADLDTLDNEEYTPLFLAASGGHTAAALPLMGAGADVNVQCELIKTPLTHRAVLGGHVEFLRAVLELGPMWMLLTHGGRRFSS